MNVHQLPVNYVAANLPGRMKFFQEIAVQTDICGVDNSELKVLFDRALDLCKNTNSIGVNICSSHLCISHNVTYRVTNAESVDLQPIPVVELRLIDNQDCSQTDLTSIQSEEGDQTGLDSSESMLEDSAKEPMEEMKCTFCGKEYYRKGLYDKHLKIHQPGVKQMPVTDKGIDEMSGDTCSEDEDINSTDDQIKPGKNNSNEKRNKKVTWQCKLCKEMFTDRRKYERHIRKHKKDEKSRNAPKEKTIRVLHECEQCKEKFTSKKKYDQHIRKHKVKKPPLSYICPHCNKDCKARTALSRHITVHTKEKNFKCHICEKYFGTDQGLTMHIKRHKGIKPHKCSHCDKSFVKKWGLVEHLRVHTGEKPYRCDICDKSFRFKNVLTSHHLSMHSGIRPFNCEICGQGFVRQYNLDEHRRNHTGEKPFKCIDCGRAFKNHRNWKLHVKKHREVSSATGVELDGSLEGEIRTRETESMFDSSTIKAIESSSSAKALETENMTSSTMAASETQATFACSEMMAQVTSISSNDIFTGHTDLSTISSDEIL